MSNQTPIINASGDFEEAIQRLAKHLGRDRTRRDVFNLIYGRGEKARSRKQIAAALGRTGNTQVVQDAVEHLAKHHLIVRVESKGHVQDGSRWAYKKADFVRANRQRIVRFADDAAAAERISTKRSPANGTTFSFIKPGVRAARTRAAARRSAPAQARMRIALLLTNPDFQNPLQTGVEARYILEGVVLGSKNREDVDLRIVPAPTLDTLLDTLNSYRPDVLHFSGHGGNRALVFDNEKAGDDGGTVLDFEMITNVLGATSAEPNLLVLVACDTVDGADRFLKEVPAVVAMAASIGDEAACEFSARFYRSLSSGETIEKSLRQAKLALRAKGYADADLPTLLVRNKGDAERSLL